MEKGYSALIYGATGAVGREVVNCLLDSPKWTTIHVVVRRQLQQWSKHPNKDKLHVEKLENMDSLLNPQNFKYEKGFDSLFSCLGSQTKHGEETFVKIDKTFPLKAADIALNNNIPHYLLVSSVGAKSSSWFMYPRVKGEVEEELKTKKLPILSIFRPGVLLGRPEERFGEKIGKYTPFFPKIETKEVARGMVRVAEREIEKSRKAESEVQLFENDAILKLLKN